MPVFEMGRIGIGKKSYFEMCEERILKLSILDIFGT